MTPLIGSPRVPSGSTPSSAGITPLGQLQEFGHGLIGDRRDPDRAGGKPRRVPIRKRYLVDDTGEGAMPMAFTLAHNAGKYGTVPRLHLLLLWLAGGKGHEDAAPFSTRRRLTDLAVALGMVGLPAKEQRRRVRGALDRLEELGLVEADAIDEVALIRLKDERGTGEDYSPPGTRSAREHFYVTLFPEYFTRGWFHVLHHSTAVTYLAMIADTEVIVDANRRDYREGFANRTHRDQRWGGWSASSYEHAVRILDHVGLIRANFRHLRARRTRTVWTVQYTGLDRDAPPRQLPDRASAADVTAGNLSRKP